MRRRKLLVVLAGLAVLAAAAGAFVLWAQPSRVAWADLAQIRIGMSRAEVRALLGEPGDYRSRPTNYGWDWSRSGPPVYYDGWYDDEAAIEVNYARCDGKFIVMNRRIGIDEEPFLRRVQRLWRRWFP
jgi:hypothetical protein